MADGKDSIDQREQSTNFSGRISTALTVTVEEQSAKAAEKISAAGVLSKATMMKRSGMNTLVGFH